ncbi:MAG: ATP-dependent Clp protease ATP-binding subunit [Verrucomicrobia bacterium]|nr:ATP-dependent Clp protease ATP-binding subunit [Verrucomicrobiota bacterium]NBS04812.1 ATP-dependent Clp protease ATP-binding subunit [Verrucomicrobiota bacterium]NBY36420.1 ATP-dependent Clp protease ATP-binding subunit [Verrucomicrobiota bacterium]
MDKDKNNNFTPRARKVVELARAEARRFNHGYVGTEHILLGLIKLGEGVAVNVLGRMGLDLKTVRAAVEKQVGPGPEEAKASETIPLTPRVQKVMSHAVTEARSLGHAYVGTEHILLGLLKEGEGVAARVLQSLDVDLERCRKEILADIDPAASASEASEKGDEPPAGEESQGDEPPSSRKSSEESGRPGRGERLSLLKTFGRDLTELARAGELDPVIGRKEEIRRVVQILCRRTKNNPVLIGEAGVGKTAIVEGLAQEIAAGIVPEILLDRKVITLDLALMVAGTKYRGQFEERIKGIMDEIKRAKNIILFIDEMHTIVGAGAAEGAMDASNILKPALSRGEIQCVGATTLSEYRKHIEKDAALERRFQSVKVDDPSPEDAVLILRGIRHKYEEHHKCEYTDAAIEAAVRLSHRYITARHLPDKAIDVMDEAGARARIRSLNVPPEIDAVQVEIDRVVKEKEDASRHQKFEEAANLRDQEKKFRAKREKMLEEWRKKRDEKRITVGEDEMMHIVADWTGVPLNRLEKKETQKLLDLEKDLQLAVIGQERACEVVSRALRRSRADLKDPRRPIGSFLFLGPTGVGKTLLARSLAERMFGESEAVIQIDMSEYMEKFTVSRLIGSPPGYVGHDEGGQLTEAVRRKPYSVVLFDEIEKAHPDVIQLLLQALEDGRLTDSLGRVVDFRNTIIIMTSNVGADVLQRNNSVGFDVGVSSTRDYEKLKERIMDETKRAFKPEFLNRLTDIVIFQQLAKEHMTKIVDIEVAKVAKRLLDLGVKLVVNEAARGYLVENGWDEKYGARPLRRAVERLLEDPLAESILRSEFNKEEPVIVSVGDKGLVFTQKKSGADAGT